MTETETYASGIGVRPEQSLALAYVAESADEARRHYVVARLACIPFTVLGACVCYRWGREIGDHSTGLAATCLWCFSPTVIAHAQRIEPGVAAAALGITSAYTFHRWLLKPTIRSAVIAGVFLGLCQLAKFTLLVLLFIYPLLWLLSRWIRKEGLMHPIFEILQMLMIYAIYLGVVNLGYGFEDSLLKLRQFSFTSQLLRSEQGYNMAENRFSNSLIGDVRIPVPRNYLQGIDIQKHEFERKMWSYLCGRWKRGGWKHYYLYAIAIKTPVAVLCLLAISLACLIRHPTCMLTFTALAAPPVTMLATLSFLGGINHHTKYVLPCLPFAFIIIATGVTSNLRQNHMRKLVVSVALSWFILSSLWCYPHSLSYFNEFVGGPHNGILYLGAGEIDSNVDAGQDYVFLKEWLDRNEPMQVRFLHSQNGFDPRALGIDVSPLPSEVDYPRPGWYAFSVGLLFDRTAKYDLFTQQERYLSIGYSIRLFHISDEREFDQISNEFLW